ncbi:uncharacterized protein LOC132947614 [Metopolophium dirhodum]|uniref:uncharacterized protein LOC132947614 n=1 Tax=Metopolophium dirhodum TaxID=44670 RepID=UPI002990351F|nr:uncharacterized protein LOC132947614 [Metopolophium dirhodum]
MSDSRNDSESFSKHDRSVSTQRSLMSFFVKKIRSDEVQDRSKVNNEENVSTSNVISAAVRDSSSKDLQTDVDNQVQKNIFADALDIGNFIDSQSSKLSNDKKYLALTKIWRPDILYNFPKDKDSRKFQLKWLNDFPWLSYSQKHEGVYCRTCVLFSRDVVGKSKENAGQLCTKPLNKYKKALELFKKHSNNDYHKFSIIKADDFKNVVESTEKDLLKFRIDSGDDVLKNHLQNCPKNSNFISKTTQNDLIDCCASVILGKIVNAIKESKYFSILVDETTDISTSKQLVLCICYVFHNKVQEDFLKLIIVENTTGYNLLSKVILRQLDDLGLNIKYLRGQCYDGGTRHRFFLTNIDG